MAKTLILKHTELSGHRKCIISDSHLSSEMLSIFHQVAVIAHPPLALSDKQLVCVAPASWLYWPKNSVGNKQMTCRICRSTKCMLWCSKYSYMMLIRSNSLHPMGTDTARAGTADSQLPMNPGRNGIFLWCKVLGYFAGLLQYFALTFNLKLTYQIKNKFVCNNYADIYIYILWNVTFFLQFHMISVAAGVCADEHAEILVCELNPEICADSLPFLFGFPW